MAPGEGTSHLAAKTTSRGGRIINATKRKLQAPIDTFMKSVKKPRTAQQPGSETGSVNSSVNASTSSIPTPIPTPALKEKPTCAPRHRGAIIVDEETDNESSNGDVLPSTAGSLMEDVQETPAQSQPASRSSTRAPSIISLEDNDDEEENELDRYKKKWDAPVYAFFKPEWDTTPVNGRACITFHCAADACRMPHPYVRRYLDLARIDASTSNLRTHAARCFGEDALAAADKAKDANEVRKTAHTNGGVLSGQSITVAFARKGKGKVMYSTRPHTEAEARAETVRWIAESKRPISIVKDRGYQSLMKTGRPQCYIPSPSTVARDIKHVFARVRSRVAKILQEHPGSIHFSTDCWTSPNHHAYAAFIVHFEQDGVPFSLLLDVVELPRSHTGLNLALEFARLLGEFGIMDKILSVTCDSASNNDAMVRELQKLVPAFAGEASLTRCFLHVINLTAKTTIRLFDAPKKKGTDSSESDNENTNNNTLNEARAALEKLAEDIDLEDAETRAHYAQEKDNSEADEDEQDDLENSTEGWVDERASLSDEERNELDAGVLPVRLAIVKLRRFSYAVLNSSTILLPLWYETLRFLGLPERAMPRDVATRWNSTYDMLTFALEYRRAIDKMAKEKQLRVYELDEGEWETVSQLTEILKVYKHATLYFSRKTPSLPTVIPAMDHIDDILTNQSINNVAFSPAIRAACSLSKKTLNRYYNKTDHSENYCIAIVLHPSYKLEYFRAREWEQDWVETAEGMVRDEFARSYADMEVAEDYDEVVALMDSSSTTKKRKQDEPNIFDSLPALPSQSRPDIRDEIDRYLAAPVEKSVADAMGWWHSRQTQFPRLSRMALDYLSIPATSVEVERCFSRGRIIVSHLRNRLTGQTTRALLCLNYWSLAGLVKDADILKVTRGTSALAGDDDTELDEGWDKIGDLD